MPWTVVYYETRTGETPIEDFLDALSPKARAKCLAYISRLEIDGTRLPAAIAKHVRGKIWELRPEWSGNEYRFFLWGDHGAALCHSPCGAEEIAEAEGGRHCAGGTTVCRYTEEVKR